MKPPPVHPGPRHASPGVLVLILTLGLCLPAFSAPQVLATVDGKPVTAAEVKTADQFAQIERECAAKKHDVLEGELDQVIRERLLAAEAAARGVSTQSILAGLKPPEISDADVAKFYDENKAQIPGPKEQFAPQIRQYLQQRGQAEAQQKLFADLSVKYKVEKKLEPIRIEVAASGPARGPATAPVTIVEFSDFQCPFCGRLFETLEQVKTKYGDKVNIVFRQFPLASIHPNAQKAAEASLCANEQGKFWEMHNAMFKNQEELAVDSLKAKAAGLGLKADAFNSCLDSGKFAAQILVDQKDGSVAGVSKTPAMFINGRFLLGAASIEQITAVIDEELKRKGGAS
jgi:protein-disulfide isomerase